MVDGKAKRRTSGEMANWNTFLKGAGYSFAESTIKVNKGPYRELYNEYKAYELKTHPELTKMHIERRTKRRIIKKFLSDIKWKFLI